MGNLTAKTSGELASFMTPSMTNIKSLKVHFSPKQLGTGDPSPENVREIVGWDGVEVTKSSVNLLDQSYITNASKWVLSSDDNNTVFCGVPVYKGVISNFYQKFKSGYPFVGNPFKKNVQYNVSVWLKTVNGNSIQGLKFGFKYTDGTTSLGGIFATNDTWKRQTVTSKANKTVSGIYCSYNNSGEIYLCGLAVCEKELDDTSVVYPSAVNNISIDWSNNIETIYGGYINLISGELVEEYKQVILDSSNTWNTGTNYLYRGGYLPSVGGKNAYVKTLCSHLKNSYDVRTAITIGKNGNLTVGKNFFDLINIEMTRDAFNQYLETQYNNGTPLQICYLLETPITHQLTPTQLQSFVGQNNFWSNTDYVEVEYDLIETEDIQKCRKKIILNQPQLKTISNKVVSFNTDMVAPMKNCKIYFKPIQLGSGDPSPTNVRDINGWTGVDSYVNGDKISVDWTSDVGTVYGGYLDLARKEVVAEWECNQLTSAQLESYECGYSSNVSYFNTSAVWIRNWNYKKIGAIISGGMDGLCNMFPISIHNKNIYASQYRIYFKVPNTITSLEDFKISIQNAENNNNGLFIAYKLATPIHYPLSSLTSQQLLTLKSTNHIWSETNGQQIDVTYWTRKNLTPTPLTNYLENQTWTDSAYISSSGKKTTNTVSASHFLTNQILLEAGTYVLSGFSHYVGTDNTNYRIHAYDSTGKWLRQITFQQIGNLSPVDISFTLDTDTYVNVSIAVDFDGILAKIN